MLGLSRRSFTTSFHRLDGRGDSGAIGRMKLLMKDGADIKAQNPRGSLVVRAARSKQQHMVKFLLEQGAVGGADDPESGEILHWSIAEGNRKLLNYVLGSGVDVNVRLNKRTALCVAVERGNTEAVRLLIARGADVNDGGDQDMYLPLCVAARTGPLQMVKALLESGADVHLPMAHNYTPLHCAAGAGHVEIMKLLLEKGVNLNARTSQRQTALHRAAFGGKVEAVKFLLDTGADPSARDQRGRTPADLGKTKEIRKMLNMP